MDIDFNKIEGTVELAQGLDTTSSIQCIVCKKKMGNWTYHNRDGELQEVQPMGGLAFRTYGHYGSCIFDPMGTREILDLAICDLCVMDNLEHIRGSGKKELEEHHDMYRAAADKK